MRETEIEAKRENDKNMKIISVVAAFFLLFVAILILVMVSKSINDEKVYKNANFVEVEATIVAYKDYIVYNSNTDMPMGIHYSTYYEYRSPNGGIYSGCWQTRIKTEEDAKAQIGKKVPLYIDDELKLQTKSLKDNNTGVLIGGIFGSICLLVSLSLFAYLIIYFVQHRLKEQTEMKGIDCKEDNEINKPKNFYTLHQIIMLLAIFATIGLTLSSLSQEKTYQKYSNAQFVEVVGEIFEYKEFELSDSVYYVTFYKYVNNEGKEYTDMWQNDIYSKDDAEAAIGSKVPLLYDKEYGVIKSMSDLEPVPKPDHTLNIILVVVFVVLFVNSLARFIRFIIRNERYKAQQKMQGKTIE
ncbi:MAG: hypothetical protein K2K85_08395 [Clostridia bacterium]|nr:hypothetical protein [Clostridia bacterium]